MGSDPQKKTGGSIGPRCGDVRIIPVVDIH